MANRPAYVNAVHALEPLEPKQRDLFPAVPPRLVRLDRAPVLFPALTTADYGPAGFLVSRARTESST
jgi:hypothetical protein